ncbi:serine hydrolase-domain-containing protein [Aspergillus unguis]
MRILCLHGHTQTGPVLDRKTARLQEHIRRAFPNASFYFPTGGIAYKVSDRLDYLDEIQRERPETFKDPDDIETHAWFRLHEDDPPRGLLESIDRVAHILQTQGPFDGIICFSQGSVVGAMAASLLEGPARRRRFEEYAKVFPKAVRYPEAYKALDHPPFKFGITYGAYMGVNPVFDAFYDPVIQTPFMHFMGEFDPVVPSEMAAAVAKAQIGGSRRRSMTHPGAHAIPVGAQYHEAAVDFIQSVTSEPYFDFHAESVPTLGYGDSPEQTPLQTPPMTPSLISCEPMCFSSGRAVRLKKPFAQLRVRGRRARSSISFTPLSGRRSTCSSSSSVDMQHSNKTVSRAVSETTDAMVQVGNELVPRFDSDDWHEMMLSDLLNEMLRRQGRPGRFYFVPAPDNETVID